jgi:hypothetical protein
MESSSRGVKRRGDPGVVGCPTSPGLLRHIPSGRTGVLRRPMARNDASGSTRNHPLQRFAHVIPVSLSVGRPDRPARPRSRSKTLLPFNRNHTGASRGRQAFVCLKRNGAAKGHFSPMAYRRPGLLAEATMRARPVASPDASAPSHGWTQRRDDPERAGNPQFAIFSRRLRTTRSR